MWDRMRDFCMHARFTTISSIVMRKNVASMQQGKYQDRPHVEFPNISFTSVVHSSIFPTQTSKSPLSSLSSASLLQSLFCLKT